MSCGWSEPRHNATKHSSLNNVSKWITEWRLRGVEGVISTKSAVVALLEQRHELFLGYIYIFLITHSGAKFGLLLMCQQPNEQRRSQTNQGCGRCDCAQTLQIAGCAENRTTSLHLWMCPILERLQTLCWSMPWTSAIIAKGLCQHLVFHCK